jgi:dihydroorotate dehydrogenase
LFDALYNHVDYFLVNVSSPNTPNLCFAGQRATHTIVTSKQELAKQNKNQFTKNCSDLTMSN